MKRLALACSVSLLMLCGGATHAAVITYSATLSGLNEAPQNNSPATGRTTVMIDDVTGMMTVNAIFSGLTGITTASHIHCCTAIPGVDTIGVATSQPSFPAFPLGVTSGNYSETFDLLNPATYAPGFIARSGGSVDGARTALLAGMAAGRSYLNIHTEAFPGGEIRGFLVAEVPEPGSIALFGLGAVGFAALWRRRPAAAA